MWNFERVLDAITNAGIYIIEKRSHTIISVSYTHLDVYKRQI